MKKRLISIIVPCFNEQGNIEELYVRVKRIFAHLARYTFELIYVDNASTDRSVDRYGKLAKKDKRVKVIIMSRNFGSPQPSFVAGLSYARGDAAVFLHGDIQDPPEMIPKFIMAWEKGYDVVYGVRSSRKGYGWIWNALYKGFYFLLNKLAYIQIPLNAGEFSLIDRAVRRELLQIDEYDYYLRCLRAYVGFRQKGIAYVRDARAHGKSTESLLSGFWWAKTILVNFSFKPLEWISSLAFFVMMLTFVMILINLVMIFAFRDSPRGIPTVVILVLFLGGIQLLSLSVIAEYLAKIFLEVKHRPKYIVKQTINVKKEAA
jgi:glycosyltransferase involved in cell wall biosynthesis